MSNSAESTLYVKLSDPRMPKGALLFLPGLGSFENEFVRQVTAEEVVTYERRAKRDFRQVIDSHPTLSFVEESPPPKTKGTVKAEQPEPVVEEETEQPSTDEETPSPRRRRRGDEE